MAKQKKWKWSQRPTVVFETDAGWITARVIPLTGTSQGVSGFGCHVVATDWTKGFEMKVSRWAPTEAAAKKIAEALVDVAEDVLSLFEPGKL
jgi:hypothetical protein